jgi:hypothetical protein
LKSDLGVISLIVGGVSVAIGIGTYIYKHFTKKDISNIKKEEIIEEYVIVDDSIIIEKKSKNEENRL